MSQGFSYSIQLFTGQRKRTGEIRIGGDEAGRRFTPAISLFVECDTEQEIEQLFHKLSEGGAVLMPLSSTPISKSFGWVSDRYGVSWQLNLRKA